MYTKNAFFVFYIKISPYSFENTVHMRTATVCSISSVYSISARIHLQINHQIKSEHGPLFYKCQSIQFYSIIL